MTIDPTNSAEVRSEFFYSGALPRITKVMPVLAALGTIALAWRVNWFFALGFALGCGIAYLNFYWLKRVVNALAERVTNARPSERGGGVFARFLLRYALIAATAYAILKISRQSLYGMLAGLFLPVAAIGCEAAYELYMALRRGC